MLANDRTAGKGECSWNRRRKSSTPITTSVSTGNHLPAQNARRSIHAARSHEGRFRRFTTWHHHGDHDARSHAGFRSLSGDVLRRSQRGESDADAVLHTLDHSFLRAPFRFSRWHRSILSVTAWQTEARAVVVPRHARAVADLTGAHRPTRGDYLQFRYCGSRVGVAGDLGDWLQHDRAGSG